MSNEQEKQREDIHITLARLSETLKGYPDPPTIILSDTAFILKYYNATHQLTVTWQAGDFLRCEEEERHWKL